MLNSGLHRGSKHPNFEIFTCLKHQTVWTVWLHGDLSTGYSYRPVFSCSVVYYAVHGSSVNVGSCVPLYHYAQLNKVVLPSESVDKILKF